MRRLAGLTLTLPLAWALGCASLGGRDPAAIAAAYAEAGRYQEAAREIEVAVRAHPDDVGLRRRAASILARSGNVDRAIGHLEIAIEGAPSDARSWIQRGEFESSRENVADAYVAYRRAAELAPEEIRAVAGLALAADNLGFEDEARSAYARWAELERKQRDDQPPAGAD